MDVAVTGGLVEPLDEQFPAEGPEDFLHAGAKHHRHGVRVGRVEDQVCVDRRGLALRVHELELDVLGDDLCGLRLLHRYSPCITSRDSLQNPFAPSTR